MPDTLGIVKRADQGRWECVWTSHLRRAATSTDDFASAVLAAESLGIEVRGNFTYVESEKLKDKRIERH